MTNKTGVSRPLMQSVDVCYQDRDTFRGNLSVESTEHDLLGLLAYLFELDTEHSSLTSLGSNPMIVQKAKSLTMELQMM